MFHLLAGVLLASLASTADEARWERENPLRPLPLSPLGIPIDLGALPHAPTPERVRLGRWLFYDPRLSADGSVACSTCHLPGHGFSEPRPVSIGIRNQKGTRKAPSIVNLGGTAYRRLFWDGRAGSLDEQAEMPIENPLEMGNTHANLLATLGAIRGYRKYFEEAFGSRELSIERVARAIGDYQRTRMSGNSAFDQARAGKAGAMSQEAHWGEAVFFGRGRCARCHGGPFFTDGSFHNEGIGWDERTQKFSDEGRFLQTGFYGDLAAFKTPSLRDASLRAPFMHDGSIATLREVIEHYNRGGISNPYLDPQLVEPLGLTDEEIDFLVNFLESLTGEGYQDQAPASFPQ